MWSLAVLWRAKYNVSLSSLPLELVDLVVERVDLRLQLGGALEVVGVDRLLHLLLLRVAPLAQRGYIARLAHAFGWRYVALVVLTYGENQGVGEALLFTAQTYFFTDDLALTPARYSSLDGFTGLPWQVKTLDQGLPF